MARLSSETWKEIQAIYCVGKRTNRELGEQFGVSHSAIQQRAEKEGWKKLDVAVVERAISAKVNLSSELSKLSNEASLESSFVSSEIDCQASIKAKSLRNAELLADKFPEMIANIESVQELQQAAKAHRDLHETHFGKNPDSQTNIQINNVTPVDALKALDSRV